MQEVLRITLDQLTFDCRTEGDKRNELVLFLHGWPETSSMWKGLMSHIAHKGFYCVAPDLRGYSKDACPEGTDHYGLDKLVDDVMGIHTYFNKSKVHLVGHDWGALIGWKFVHDHPEIIRSWTALSVPHPQAFGKALVTDQEQIRMSRYVREFQRPKLPERQIEKDDFQLLRRLWKHHSAEEIADYLSVFGNPGQLTASLNYYRSNYDWLRKSSQEEILGAIDVPTLFIWGNKDVAIGAFSVEESHQYMHNDYTFIELDAGHWLIQTNYVDLAKAIGDHLKQNRSRPE